MDEKTRKFIEKAKLTHVNKYDYSKSIYTKLEEFTIIICSIHGEFQQKPKHHLKGAGCRKCANKAIANARAGGEINTQIFIERAKEIHGDRYMNFMDHIITEI